MDLLGLHQVAAWLQKLPEDKRLRNIFYGLQSLFTVFFAAHAYKYFIGEYTLYDLTETTKIMEFVLSGRAILALFFFGGVWYLFYEIFYWVVKTIYVRVVRTLLAFLWWLVKKIPQMKEKMRTHIDEGLIKNKAIKTTQQGNERGVNYSETLNTFKKMKEFSEKRYLMFLLLLIMTIQFYTIYFYFLNLENERIWLISIAVKFILGASLFSFFMNALVNEFLIKISKTFIKRLYQFEE